MEALATKIHHLVEKVKIQAVNMVGGLKGATYSEKLKEFGLQSLQARRKEAD